MGTEVRLSGWFQNIQTMFARSIEEEMKRPAFVTRGQNSRRSQGGGVRGGNVAVSKHATLQNIGRLLKHLHEKTRFALFRLVYTAHYARRRRKDKSTRNWMVRKGFTVGE